MGHIEVGPVMQDRRPPAHIEVGPVMQDRRPPGYIQITHPEPKTPALANKELRDIRSRAAARDLEAFLKRYADLRKHQPMLEEPVFEKIEEAIRRLRPDRE
jgi:hypothetical protein